MHLNVCLEAFMNSEMGYPLPSLSRIFGLKWANKNGRDHKLKIRIKETYNRANRSENQHWNRGFGNNEQHTYENKSKQP